MNMVHQKVAIYNNRIKESAELIFDVSANIRARVAVEAAHVDYWYKFVGLDGKVIGMTTYGESAPADQLYKEFGITTDAVVEAVNSLVQ